MKGASHNEQQQVELELSRDQRPPVSRTANLESDGSRSTAVEQVQPDVVEFHP